jgi:outer membrane protein
MGTLDLTNHRMAKAMRSLALATIAAPLLISLGVGVTRAEEAQAPAPASSGRVLSLARVQEIATAHQPQVVVARAQTNVAEAQAEQVRAPLLPQVVATAQYTRETGNFVPRPSFITQTQTQIAGAGAPSGWSLSTSFDFWNFGLNATQLVYDFGQTSQRYHAARATVDAQRYVETTTRVQILLNVRRAYFSARAQKELVTVAHETLDAQNRHLIQVQQMVGVGTQPPIALAQQKAAVANAQVQVITAENNYETSKAQLNQAAGIPGGTDYDVGNEDVLPVDDEDQPLDTLVSKAVAGRPELGQLERQRIAQEASLSSAKGGYGPTLSASAGITESGLALDGLVPNWNAGLLLSWPIFQGGLTIGQVHQAEAGLESIDAQKSLEELQIRLDVDSARLAVRAAKASIGAAQDAVTSAHLQLQLAEQRYATGVGNIIELNDAQVAYTTAAAQLVQARYGLASARAQLLAALGRT